MVSETMPTSNSRRWDFSAVRSLPSHSHTNVKDYNTKEKKKVKLFRISLLFLFFFPRSCLHPNSLAQLTLGTWRISLSKSHDQKRFVLQVLNRINRSKIGLIITELIITLIEENVPPQSDSWVILMAIGWWKRPGKTDKEIRFSIFFK